MVVDKSSSVVSVLIRLWIDLFGIIYIRDNCKISSLLKSNSKIGPLFEFFTKSVHFYYKIGSLCDESGSILQ
jgi:hypothetical protein